MQEPYSVKLASYVARRDKAERKWPDFISFDITSRCNFCCIHCYNNSGDGKGDLTRGEIIDVAKQIVELHPYNVCLCGGEPLTSPYLFDIINTIKNGKTLVTLVTNGYLLTEGLCEKLVSHGIEGVQVSLDGAFSWQHDTIRGIDGSFYKAINAIKQLKNAGMKQVSTSCLPSKLNVGYMADYVRLCLSMGVDNIRCMPFLASGRGRTEGSDLMLDEDGYFRFCRELVKLRRKYIGKINIEWDDALSLILYEKNLVNDDNKTLNIEIRHNGDIVPTDYFPIVAGNITRHRLSEYWFGGYDYIWKSEIIKNYIHDFHNTEDILRLKPLPYSGEEIKFDLLEV